MIKELLEKANLQRRTYVGQHKCLFVIEELFNQALAELDKPCELQTEVGAWAKTVFGKSQTITGIINHLIKEVGELQDSNSPDEAADCLLLLCQHAHECGYDLIEAAWKKHRINLKRKWGKPDEHGVIEHIRKTPKRPDVICLCGSTRFTAQMLIKQWELTKQGKIVLSWCALPDSYFSGEDKTHIGDQEGVKEIVDTVHLRKIDLSDKVFVVNVEGYIGDSTRSEIEYAKSKGVPVEYLEAPIKEQANG